MSFLVCECYLRAIGKCQIIGIWVADDTTREVSPKLIFLRSGISGTIIDSTDSAPLAGVAVSIEGVENATSGLDGNFTISNIGPGVYTITFTLNSYTSFSISGITLEPNQIINGLSIKMHPLVGSISGTVKDTAGNPISAVIVIADSSHKDITGDDGAFTISNLREGFYTLKLTSTQFAPAVSDTIDLKAGKDTSDFNFILHYMKSSIRGTIRDTRGNPINNASVVIDGVISTTTLPDGSYTLANILPGTYTIAVSHLDYLTSQINNVALLVNQQLSGINSMLTSKYGVVTGVITDSLNVPIEGVRVALGTLHTTTSSSSGTFSFGRILAGQYRMSFNHDRYILKIIDTIIVPNGGDTLSIPKTILKTIFGSIQGRVVDSSSGTGISGVSVTINQNGTTTTTNNNGSFTTPNILPGRYAITYTHANYGTKTGDTITITSGQTLTNVVVMMVQLRSSISGKVTDKESRLPISGAAVTLSGLGIASITNSNGEYVLSNVPQGSYSTTFTHSDYVDTTTQTITLGPGEHLAGKNVAITKKKGVLTGIVYNQQTRATLSGASITLSPGGRTTTTGLSGSFTISDLTAQEYTLQLSAGSGYFDTVYTSIVIKPGKETIDTLYIKEKNHTKTIGGSLAGTASVVNRITATVTGDSIKVTNPLVSTLTWFQAAMQYSGTVEIPPVGTQWSVEIRVFDTNGKLTGYKKESFSRASGAIAMPSFNCENALPKASAGNDTLVSINDQINLHGNAIDSFNINGEITSFSARANITTWEWSINGSAFAKRKADTTITAPSTANTNYWCILRVTDSDGNTSYPDTLNVTVIADIPVANAGNDTTLPMRDPFTLKGSASQQFGTINKWEWSINGSPFRQTAKDTTITAPAVDTEWVCILKATDNDLNCDSDTVILSFGIWEPVENGVISDGSVGYFEVKANNDNAYIAFLDYFNDTGLTVIRLESNNVQIIGKRLFDGEVVRNNGAASPLSLAADNNSNVGLMFRKKLNNNTDSSSFLVVKYSNNNWNTYGPQFDTLQNGLTYTKDYGSTFFLNNFYYSFGNGFNEILENSIKQSKKSSSSPFGSIRCQLFEYNNELYACCNDFIAYNYKNLSIYKFANDSTLTITSISGIYQNVNMFANTFYLLYSDYTATGQLKFATFNGSTLTSSTINSVPKDSLIGLTSCYANSSNYVVYPYRVSTSTKYRVGKITHGIWKELNSIDDFNISEPELFSTNNTVYLAYKNSNNGGRLTLLKLD